MHQPEMVYAPSASSKETLKIGLVQMMEHPSLDEIRTYCAGQLATLWPEVLRFDYPHNYYVDLSEKLLKIKLDLLNAGGKSQG